jgi:hypothetical protein
MNLLRLPYSVFYDATNNSHGSCMPIHSPTNRIFYILFTSTLPCWIMQALFVFLLLPLLSNLKGIPLAELPAYVNRGAACFLNIDGNLNGEYCSSL